MQKKRSKHEQRQLRARQTSFTTREKNGELHLAGYFAVFNSVYEIAPDMSESIAPGAFSGTLNKDVRALTNHDSTLVLGRKSAGTLTLREDSHGLWCDILINQKDTAAMNTYARVQRGDVSQCSIGFTIEDEDQEWHQDGSVHWTIKRIRLYEVSVCTFPAYEETGVTARQKGQKPKPPQSLAAWKAEMLRKIHHQKSK